MLNNNPFSNSNPWSDMIEKLVTLGYYILAEIRYIYVILGKQHLTGKQCPICLLLSSLSSSGIHKRIKHTITSMQNSLDKVVANILTWELGAVFIFVTSFLQVARFQCDNVSHISYSLKSV